MKILDDQCIVHSMNRKQDLDEAVGSYKDIDKVMNSQTDLVEILTELKPIMSVKDKAPKFSYKELRMQKKCKHDGSIISAFGSITNIMTLEKTVTSMTHICCKCKKEWTEEEFKIQMEATNEDSGKDN